MDMAITGLDSVVYGVDDLDVARRFWTDFGLSPAADTPDGLTFATTEGATVEVRPAGDSTLPPGLAAGNTAREFVWGVKSAGDLRKIAAALGSDREVRTDREGTLHSTDALGYGIGFRVSRVTHVPIEPTTYNVPGSPARVNERGKVYERATPHRMSHVVLVAPDLEKQFAFYNERLDFKITDKYPGRGYFLRCAGSHEHHNLFLLHGGDTIGFHHLAFELRDIHEVFGGGLHMSDCGWKTHLGPGRHPLSSCYFWYFRNPCGGAAEYDSDSDYVTDDWVPKEWESTPESFAEWAYAEGAARFSGIQTGKA
jgi:catechol 2,3-dioxygenase-like lactoylglutathione lyase family enzyme